MNGFLLVVDTATFRHNSILPWELRKSFFGMSVQVRTRKNKEWKEARREGKKEIGRRRMLRTSMTRIHHSNEALRVTRYITSVYAATVERRFTVDGLSRPSICAVMGLLPRHCLRCVRSLYEDEQTFSRRGLRLSTVSSLFGLL